MKGSVIRLKLILAKIAGLDGAFLLFIGTATIERLEDFVVEETVSDPAIWELMYFGKIVDEEKRTCN